MFLIHYGWRETLIVASQKPLFVSFLIHYGWRETRDVLI